MISSVQTPGCVAPAGRKYPDDEQTFINCNNIQQMNPCSDLINSANQNNNNGSSNSIEVSSSQCTASVTTSPLTSQSFILALSSVNMSLSSDVEQTREPLSLLETLLLKKD